MISTNSINKTKLYWTLQGLGWGLYFIIFSSIAGGFAGFHWQVYAGYLNVTLTGLLISHLYRAYIIRNQWIKVEIIKLALRVLFASFLIGLVWNLITLPINYTFLFIDKADNELNLLLVVITTINHSIVILGWSLVYFTFQFFFNFKQSEVEKWRLEAAVKQAELIALKSQVNPHFIFNSLNNIRSLVIENPEKARDMITHLSGLLRYSIQFNNREIVSLEDELEIVQNYLNLESIQFEDRLRYKLEVKPETLEKKIPPMAIQLLVENAIKHGISNIPEGGEINIKSYLDHDVLVVEVINTGQLKLESDSTGIGLKNASERLTLLFGKLSDLNIKNINSNQVAARFTIPIN